MLAVALPAMAQVASVLGAGIAQLTARYTVRVSVWLIPGPAMGLGERDDHGQRDDGHCEEAGGEHRLLLISGSGRG